MFEELKKLVFKTKLEPEDDNKTEQESLEDVTEPDTKVVDIHGMVNYLSLYDEKFKNIEELIDTYRNMASNFEISDALDEIENEAIVIEDDQSITINTDKLEISKSIKDKIENEFNEILYLLNWNSDAFTIFRQWFVEGRLYYQKVISKNKKEGIKKLVKLDSKKIQRFKKKDTEEIYYRYIKDEENKIEYAIPKDALTFVPSGIVDSTQSFYISELHKTIRPLNNYRLMMDSALIYYITRAPQKRAFYIDVGQAPPKKAEEIVKKMMQKFAQRISYDSVSGKVVQHRRSIPVNEDYWMATRGDTRSTKIEPIEGDTNLLDPEILAVYRKALYKSLGVPFSRVDEDAGSNIDFGNTGEISRQELKLFKQTQKRRKRFSKLFDDILKTQLIVKGIIKPEEWKEIKKGIYYIWKNDSYITMIKQQDILSKQIEIADALQQYVGKYFSHDYVKKNVFKLSDDDIETYNKQIEEEKNNKMYNNEENQDEM